MKSGTEGVATSNYGRNLMKEMMLVYDGDQHRYAQIAGHGFRILAEAMHYWNDANVIKRFITEYPQYKSRIKNTECTKGEKL